MSIITVLSLRSPDNAARAVEAGAGDLAIQAMQKFPAAQQLQRNSCFMIRNLVVRNPENRQDLHPPLFFFFLSNSFSSSSLGTLAFEIAHQFALFCLTELFCLIMELRNTYARPNKCITAVRMQPLMR